ncbi:receptor-type tyrosine-protein phosphatase alpha-like [Actinia tenebrosa]|uniref:Receptor-type tyrosine-protein phosphatase alpha-like n=1 Tax=Actinia tenebrosa TaxID=6105 RepID=A0A6P8IS06_ACTTE|nr:receptor-type tyrosine-protein phosphatase alpha-like [Actinia tenebrosa]
MMLKMEDLTRSFLYAVISFSLLSFATGDVRFTRSPPSKIFAIEDNTTKLNWEYYVSDKTTDFALKSPIWEYSNDNGKNWIEIANEAIARSWNWTVSASCPPSLKPRLKKLYNATIQIVNVTFNDTGTYRCRLMLSSGTSIPRTTILNVTSKGQTKVPSTVTTGGGDGTESGSEDGNRTTATSTPSSEPPCDTTCIVIIIVVIVILILVIIVAVYCYKKKQKLRLERAREGNESKKGSLN